MANITQTMKKGRKSIGGCIAIVLLTLILLVNERRFNTLGEGTGYCRIHRSRNSYSRSYSHLNQRIQWLKRKSGAGWS